MAQIEVTEMYPRCRRAFAPDVEEEIPLALDQIAVSMRQGCTVSIYVDGWSDPWECFEDAFGALRARCPTAPKVVPRVVHVSPDGARYTGEEDGDE